MFRLTNMHRKPGNTGKGNKGNTGLNLEKWNKSGLMLNVIKNRNQDFQVIQD